MKKIMFTLLSAAIFLASCSEKKSEEKTAGANLDMEAVKKVIDSSNLAFAVAAIKGDSAAIVGCYGSDAMVLGPNAPAMSPAEFASGVTKMGAKEASLTSTNLYGMGDIVAEEGTYVLTGEGGAPMDKGKYLVLWKNYDGTWKMFRDCFNSDNPLPTH